MQRNNVTDEGKIIVHWIPGVAILNVTGLLLAGVNTFQKYDFEIDAFGLWNIQQSAFHRLEQLLVKSFLGFSLAVAQRRYCDG